MVYFIFANNTLFRNKRFMLYEIVYRKDSKFANIFGITKPK